MKDRTKRVIHVVLDEKTLVRRKPEVEHERAVAIYDLIEENYFEPIEYADSGPYNLHLSIEEGRLGLDIRTQ
jgi:uncharacterized protein (UPF0262 family)